MRPIPLLLVLLLAACASGDAARRTEARPVARPTEADHRAVAALRESLPALLERQAEALWEAWIAGSPVEAEALDAGQGDLVDAAGLEALRRVRAAAAGEGERRSLLRLERFVAGTLLASAAAPATSRIAAVEAEATFEWEGASIPFAQLEPMLAAEASASRRAELQEAARPVLARLAPLVAARDRAVEEAARALGYDGALQAAAFLQGLPPEAIAALADEVLEASDPLLEETFDPIVRMQLGLGVEALRRADTPRLLYGLRVASRIDGDAIAALEEALAAMELSLEGIRLETGPGLLPLALAVAPPADVRLALPARTRDWGPVFREAGAALHAAHLRDAPFEATRLAGGTTSRAFATLFAGLVSDPAWLEAHTALTAAEAEAHASAAAGRRLLLVRRHAGRLLAAIAGEDAGRAREAMERAYGHALADVDAAWLGLDRDLWLGGAEALRGWILAAMLEEHLIERHGAAWWSQPAAGAELQRLWAESTGATPEALAAAIDADRLDVATLVRRLEARFAPSRERVERILREHAPRPAEADEADEGDEANEPRT